MFHEEITWSLILFIKISITMSEFCKIGKHKIAVIFRVPYFALSGFRFEIFEPHFVHCILWQRQIQRANFKWIDCRNLRSLTRRPRIYVYWIIFMLNLTLYLKQNANYYEFYWTETRFGTWNVMMVSRHQIQFLCGVLGFHEKKMRMVEFL